MSRLFAFGLTIFFSLNIAHAELAGDGFAALPGDGAAGDGFAALPKDAAEKAEDDGSAALPGRGEEAGKDGPTADDLNFDDEFGEFEALDASELATDADVEKVEASSPWAKPNFRLALFALAFTLLAGFLVRTRYARPLRGVFLVASVAILGFWWGGCPCPIMSVQKPLLSLVGAHSCKSSWVYFLGLIPITYLLGRVWCGWICHLGAFQELIYRPGRFDRLKGPRTQRLLSGLRWVALVALVAQILITRSNWWVKIDPFKAAFNLTSYYTTGWVLLGVVIVTSVFIYRPFCRGACPVGLLLGLVSRLPGASRLTAGDGCVSCRRCTDTCRAGAITREDRVVIFHPMDCEMCGECLDVCHKDSVVFVRRGRNS